MTDMDENEVLTEAKKIVELRKKGVPAWEAEFALSRDQYDSIYRNTEFTLTEILKPGFFNEWRDELNVGNLIDVHLGRPEDGIKRHWLQVIVKTKAGSEDVLVSLGDRNGHFTPCGPCWWTLGLTPAASIDDIETAYREMSKKFHPDTGGSNEEFQDLATARDECREAIGEPVEEVKPKPAKAA